MNIKKANDLVMKDSALSYRAIRESAREADFVASTSAVDAHGEVIDQGSWQLDHFKQNPVILYAHDARELPIGKATNIGVRDGQLEVTIQFADHERAEEVWSLVQDQVLKAVSVGFVPVDGGYEMRDGNEVWVWSRSILKEISVVPVPANHEALAKAEAIAKAKSCLLADRDRKKAVDIAVDAGLLSEADRADFAALDGALYKSMIAKRAAARAVAPAEAPKPEPTRAQAGPTGDDAVKAFNALGSEEHRPDPDAEANAVVRRWEEEDARKKELLRRRMNGEETRSEKELASERARKEWDAIADAPTEGSADIRWAERQAAVERRNAEGEKQHVSGNTKKAVDLFNGLGE